MFNESNKLNKVPYFGLEKSNTTCFSIKAPLPALTALAGCIVVVVGCTGVAVSLISQVKLVAVPSVSCLMVILAEPFLGSLGW